eukprot:UN05569
MLFIFSLFDTVRNNFYFLTICDFITCICIFYFTREVQLYMQNELKQLIITKDENVQFYKTNSEQFPRLLSVLFWINPFGMLANAGLSCVAVTHLVYVLTGLLFAKKHALLCGFCLAFGTLIDAYHR